MATGKTAPPDELAEKRKARSGKGELNNGNKRGPGKAFTRETAQEAAKKSHEMQARRKSIKQSFLAMMEEEMIVVENGKRVKRTGAEAIAKSIISGSIRNNARMTELALALLDEKPNDKVDFTVAIPKFENLDEAFKQMHGDGQ